MDTYYKKAVRQETLLIHRRTLYNDIIIYGRDLKKTPEVL